MEYSAGEIGVGSQVVCVANIHTSVIPCRGTVIYATAVISGTVRVVRIGSRFCRFWVANHSRTIHIQFATDAHTSAIFGLVVGNLSAAHIEYGRGAIGLFGTYKYTATTISLVFCYKAAGHIQR